LEVGIAFYSQTIEYVVPVSSARAAEMVKVFENTFRAVNIALVNEIALLCDKMGVNVMPFYPGPGVGGHCIPLDPHYLEWKAREYNFTTRFIGLAGEINRKMPEFVKEKVIRTLNDIGKAPSKSKVLIIGMAYKKDIEDVRESPALHISGYLMDVGVKVLYYDPYISSIEINHRILKSSPLSDKLLETVDLVVIITDHSIIDYGWLVDKAKRILDTRNATKNVRNRNAKVVLL